MWPHEHLTTLIFLIWSCSKWKKKTCGETWREIIYSFIIQWKFSFKVGTIYMYLKKMNMQACLVLFQHDIFCSPSVVFYFFSFLLRLLPCVQFLAHSIISEVFFFLTFFIIIIFWLLWPYFWFYLIVAGFFLFSFGDFYTYY